MGDADEIDALRARCLPEYDSAVCRDMLKMDLPRTFPREPWFQDHMSTLTAILSAYASTNPGMGYAQGMAFPVFVLYRTYYVDDPKHARVDTYYSFHRLIHVVRPMYPLNSDDSRPTTFTKHINALLPLLVSLVDAPFACRLKRFPIILYAFALQSLPTLFTNKFHLYDSPTVFDFIVNVSPVRMFQRALCTLASIIVLFKPIFMYMEYEKILEIINIRAYYDVDRIVRIAQLLDRQVDISVYF